MVGLFGGFAALALAGCDASAQPVMGRPVCARELVYVGGAVVANVDCCRITNGADVALSCVRVAP